MPSQQTGRRMKKHRWRARVRLNGPEVYLGTFETKEEAAKAEDQFRKKTEFDRQAGSVDSYLWD